MLPADARGVDVDMVSPIASTQNMDAVRSLVLVMKASGSERSCKNALPVLLNDSVAAASCISRVTTDSAARFEGLDCTEKRSGSELHP